MYRGVEPQVTIGLGLPLKWLLRPGLTPAATVSGTSFVDNGRDTLVRYYYAVTAENGEGESGPAPGNTFVMVTAAPDAPIWGIADLHNHQFAKLGFGGQMFWRAPFHLEGIEHALGWCNGGSTAGRSGTPTRTSRCTTTGWSARSSAG